jgi:hypothetical protein
MKLTKPFLFLITSLITLHAQTENSVLKNLSLPPVSTFAEACARCHGDEGKNYGKDFAKLDTEELHHITEDMMYGPAYLEPTKTEIEAMTSYQRAISKDEPFIVITNAASYLEGKDDKLKLEISLNAELAGNENIEIQKGKNEYQYLLKASDKTEIKITAKRGDKTTSITFPQNIYSHSKE